MGWLDRRSVKRHLKRNDPFLVSNDFNLKTSRDFVCHCLKKHNTQICYAPVFNSTIEIKNVSSYINRQ